jgi:phosphotransferase system HPr (HPr) family protein
MRPAKQVVELANSFPCEVNVVVGGQEADAKSILGLIGLGAEAGDEVVIRARGERAAEAAEALQSLLSALPELHGEPEDGKAPEPSRGAAKRRKSARRRASEGRGREAKRPRGGPSSGPR